jgi:hypothetical protein
MLGLAYYLFWPPVARIMEIVFYLYTGLALAEFAVGLFKVLVPRAEGVLLDAFVLLLFAGWNLGWQALRVQAGMQPTPVILVLGLYMLFGAFARFRHYGALRQLFRERPDREHIAWFDDLVREIQWADPNSDDLVLDLPTRPHWKAKLLGSTAFFVATDGNSVWVAGPDEFSLRREKTEHGTGSRKALLNIHGMDYPEFTLSDVSWANYTKWMATLAQANPALETGTQVS